MRGGVKGRESTMGPKRGGEGGSKLVEMEGASVGASASKWGGTGRRSALAGAMELFFGGGGGGGFGPSTLARHKTSS